MKEDRYKKELEFNANVNRHFGWLRGVLKGPMHAVITADENGRWEYVNETVELKHGDFIHYWTLVTFVDGRNYYMFEMNRTVVLNDTTDENTGQL